MLDEMTGRGGLGLAPSFAHSAAPGVLVELLEEPRVVVRGHGPPAPAPSRPGCGPGTSKEEPQDSAEDRQDDDDDEPEQLRQGTDIGTRGAHDIDDERDIQCDEHQDPEHAQHQPPPSDQSNVTEPRRALATMADTVGP